MIERAESIRGGETALRPAIEGAGMRKSYALMVGLAAALGLAVLGGCSLYDGGIFGTLSWTGTLHRNSDFASTSGFPLYPTSGYEYAISEGSHYFVYYIEGGSTRDPYLVSYSFERDPGTEDNYGDDLHFTIYCQDNGYILSESMTPRAISGNSSYTVKPDGVPVTFQKGAYKITVSVKPVTLTEAERASFISLGSATK